MLFNGKNVNNLQAYRGYFSIKDLLDAIRSKFSFGTWLQQLETGCSLDDAEMHQLAQIRAAFEAWVQSTEPQGPVDRKEDQTVPVRYKNTKLEQCFLKWQSEAEKNGKSTAVGNFRVLLQLLLNLADRGDVSEEEIDILRNSLVMLGYLRALLTLKRINNQVVGVYEGDDLLYKKICACSVLPERKTLYAVSHPDTGYIAIEEDGSLCNGSAFFIPAIKEKAVMVDMNQYGYVILLESGTVIHNLPFVDVPDVSVHKITLSEDTLAIDQA